MVYALLANHALNGRYRVQAMADLLSSLAALMRTEAGQFNPRDDSGDVREVPAPLLGQLLREQAALADQLQATRDIVLESPRTPRRRAAALRSPTRRTSLSGARRSASPTATR